MPKRRIRQTRPRHDARYKRLFADARTVRDTLLATASNLTGGYDLSTLERLPASFVTRHLGQRHADMLWRVRTVRDESVHVMVLFEFQSTVDPDMADRIADYVLRIREGFRATKDRGARLPMVLPIVVYNGVRPWNAATDIGDSVGRVSDEMLGYLPRLPYLLIELQKVDPSLLPPDNVLAMIARIEQADSSERLTELDVSLDAWVERAGVSQLAEVFRKWIAEGFVLQVGEPGTERVQDIWKEETDDMSMMLEWARQRGEERDRRERERERQWRERERQWQEQGRQLRERLKQGLEQGRREGIERARALVRRLAARRFDAETVGRLVPVLDSLSDPDRIEAVADAVVEARTGDELLARASEV